MIRFKPYIRAVARWLIANSAEVNRIYNTGTSEDKDKLTGAFINLAHKYYPDKEASEDCFIYLFLTEEGAKSLSKTMKEERVKLSAN